MWPKKSGPGYLARVYSCVVGVGCVGVKVFDSTSNYGNEMVTKRLDIGV